MDEEDVNSVVAMDGLSIRSLILLIERLQQTETATQFVNREAELDDAYRHADADLRLAQSEGTNDEGLDELRRIRRHVIQAHDLVGESNVSAAVEELGHVVEIKIGLDSPTEGEPKT